MSQKIYVLRLEGGKYYVGRTKNSSQRIEQHLLGEGSAWTNKHQVIDIVEEFTTQDLEDEDKTVMKYMRLHGKDNVRGGSFSRIDLSQEDRNIIERLSRGSKDKCFECGGDDHFVKDCPHAKRAARVERVKTCAKCSRTGHTARDCYSNSCVECGRTGHTARECYAKTDVYGRRFY